MNATLGRWEGCRHRRENRFLIMEGHRHPREVDLIDGHIDGAGVGTPASIVPTLQMLRMRSRSAVPSACRLARCSMRCGGVIRPLWAVVTLEEDQGGVAIGPHTQWDFSQASFDPKIVHTSRLEPSDRIQ